MLVAQCSLPHVGKLDCALGTGVHEPVATLRVELCSRDDFRELLHVRRFDVHNVKALILDIKVPEVDPKIVAADKRLAVTVDGDAVDVVCVRVSVRPPRYSRYNSVMMCHARQLQHRGILERCTGRTGSPSTTDTRRSQLTREVVLCDNLQ